MKKTHIYLCAVWTVILILSSVVTIAADSVQPIYTVNDLKNISHNLSGSYRLMNDITLTDPWTPIGSAASPFTGTLDGNGHSVKNLTFSEKKSYCGLFAFVYGAKISDLSLYGDIDDRVTIQPFEKLSCSYCGAFAGGCRDSIFENCLNYCNVSCDSYSGGFCGISLGSRFSGCHNHGNIIAENYCGGICGRFTGGTLNGCSNYGIISADTYTGGLIGQTYAHSSYNSISIANSFNSGKVVTNSIYGGGILGYSSSDGSTVIADCFNLGSVYSESTSAILGGIVGGTTSKSAHALTVSRCYNAGIISQEGTCGGISGGTHLTVDACFFLSNSVQYDVPNGSVSPVTYAQMCTQSTFTGFNFNNTWKFAESGDFKYPELKSNPISFSKAPAELTVASLPVLTEYISGDTSFSTSGLSLKVVYTDGTSEMLTNGFTVSRSSLVPGPNKITLDYMGASTYYNVNMYNSYTERDLLRSLGNDFIPIYSGENLETARYFPHNSYFFMNDAEVTDFRGIGSIYDPLTGTVIGNGHTVTLKGNSSALFNVCDGTTVTDLNISGTVSGSGCIGSAVSHARNTLLHSVTSDATVEGSSSFGIAYCGGIVGYYECSSDGVNISDCTFSGSVTVKDRIENASVGGIVGVCLASSGAKPSLNTSASYGTLSIADSSVAYAGGITGYISSFSGISHINVSKCFNLGSISVEASSVNVGGIIGAYKNTSGNSGNTLIAENLFNAGNIYAHSARSPLYAGGIISSLAYSELRHSYSLGSISGYSYDSAHIGAVTASADGGTVADCFYTNGNDNYAQKLSWEDSTIQTAYGGFDFSAIWTFGQEYMHPQLTDNPIDTSLLASASNYPVTITGTADTWLTANAPLPAAFEWLVDGIQIATDQTYVPDDSVLGKTVTLRARYYGAFFGFAEANFKMPAYKSIASGTYSIRETKITNVLPGTHVGEMLANIQYLPQNFSILKNGNVLDDNDIVSSGCVLALNYPQSTVLYTVSVKGDINCDGLSDTTDYTMLREYLLKGGVLPSFDSADMNGDGVINAKDSVLLKQYIN